MAVVALSDNFFLNEFTRSQTATRHGIVIEVAPDSPVYLNLQRLCRVVLQPMRDALGPVFISSGYRPVQLNRLIGGSNDSQHLRGLAADFVVLGYPPLWVCEWISENLPFAFDQLIHEYGQWVHVSIAEETSVPRNQCLTAYKKVVRGKKPQTVYVPGLHKIETLPQAA